MYLIPLSIFGCLLAPSLSRHRAPRIRQGKGEWADLYFMLRARDLEWSLIGNDNGAAVAYCHGKHRDNKGYRAEKSRIGTTPKV